MKIIYLVLDGAAGDPSLGETAYMVAEKPNLDGLAKRGVCGMVYTVGKGVAPESDAAVLSILGYDPDKDYTGRGPLEALGLGMNLIEGKEIAFRGNFATVDPETGRLIDRRVGRSLTSQEASILASHLNGMLLDGGEGYVRVKSSIGHRISVIIGHRRKKLSDNVGNTDPAYDRKGRISVSLKSYKPYIRKCYPLDTTEESFTTCRLVDEFTQKAREVLSNHPVNRERISKGLLPANAVLLRDAGGSVPKLEPLEKIYRGLKFKALVEMPVEAGIARASGMRIIEIPPPTGNLKEDYSLRAEKVIGELEENTLIYAHLKGPDEPGHDGDLDRKKRAIEMIDRHFVSRVMEILDDETGIIVTSDHATPWQLKSHSDAPVPLLVYIRGLEPDSTEAFNEIECMKGKLGLLPSGRNILPVSLRALGWKV